MNKKAETMKWVKMNLHLVWAQLLRLLHLWLPKLQPPSNQTLFLLLLLLLLELLLMFLCLYLFKTYV